MSAIPTTSGPKANEGTGLWLYKIVSGGLIVFLIGLHFVVNHFIGSAKGLLTWEEVVKYYDNLLIPVVEVVFLGTVVSHALVGLRSILLDLHPGRGLLRAIDVALSLVGVAAFAWGAYLIVKVVSF